MSRFVELVFRGDNRSAVHALSGIATESDKTTRKLKRDTHESGTAFGAMGAASGKLKGAIGGLAGAAGLGGLAFGIRSVVSAGELWQSQQVQLRGALQNTGQYSKSTLDILEAAAAKLAGHGGFATSENIHALTQLTTATGSANKALRDMGLATDIARRTGRDYATVVKAVGLAEQGHTTGLTRLGIVVPKVTAASDALSHSHQKVTAAQRAQAAAQDELASKTQAITTLQHTYNQSTAVFSRSTAGQVSNLKNNFKTLEERVGAGLLPVINKLVSGLAATVGWLGKHRAVLYGVLAVTTAFTAAVAFNAIATTIATTKQYLFGIASATTAVATDTATVSVGGLTAATALFGVIFEATIVGAVIAAIVLMVIHFDKVKKAAQAAWQWIKSHWPLIAEILLGAFIGPVGIIVALFHKQIIGAVQSVWHFIEKAASGIFKALTWPFKEAWKVISHYGPLGAILNLASGHPGGALKAATFGLLNTGGVVKPRYLASGGPVGRDTVPGWLTPGEGVVNTRGMGALGNSGLAALNAGHAPAGGGGEITYAQPLILKVDGRVLAEAVTRAVIRKAARGPSSLSGGSLMAGPSHAA